MKKKIILTLLFLISLTPMFLSQFGWEGIDSDFEIPGYISLLNPVGITSVILYFCGIWCDFKNIKLNRAFCVIGLIGTVFSKIFVFLPWLVYNTMSVFSIRYLFYYALPEFYFGLFISVAMLICYLLIEYRYKK